MLYHVPSLRIYLGRGFGKFRGSYIFNLSVFAIMPFSFNDVKILQDV